MFLNMSRGLVKSLVELGVFDVERWPTQRFLSFA